MTKRELHALFEETLHRVNDATVRDDQLREWLEMRLALVLDPDGSVPGFYSWWEQTKGKHAKPHCKTRWLRNNYEAEAALIQRHYAHMLKTKQWRNGFVPHNRTYLTAEDWRLPESDWPAVVVEQQSNKYDPMEFAYLRVLVHEATRRTRDGGNPRRPTPQYRAHQEQVNQEWKRHWDGRQSPGGDVSYRAACRLYPDAAERERQSA